MRKKVKNKETEIFHYISKMACCMVLTYFIFFQNFRQFPNKNIYETKINIEESSERKLTEKNFCVVSSMARQPVDSRHKSFLYKFLSRLFFTLESWN